MIVIDVGCATHGRDRSVDRLLDRFKPDALIGFDPASDVAKAMPATVQGPNPRMVISLRREAAWLYDGEVGFTGSGSVAHVTDDPEAPKVRCIDLARFIDDLPPGPVVLKIDAEGAEYELLEHLIERNVDARLDRLLVEWHPRGEGDRRHAIEMALTCPVEQWRW